MTRRPEPKSVLSIRLRPRTIAAMRRRAAADNRNVSNYIESLVERDLGRQVEEARGGSTGRPDLAAIIRILREHRSELEDMGVRHASVFGSVARGDDRPDSDVDILIEVDPSVVKSIFAYGGIQQSIESWLQRPIDLADKGRLRLGAAAEAERDRVAAF